MPTLPAPRRTDSASFAEVKPGYVMRFPQDEGDHPDFRIEWWYVTGWLDTGNAPLGFQITFFRTRLARQDGNPSAFAPRQIMIAHAALSDPAHGRLIHNQRAARTAFGLAGTAENDLHVWIDDWQLRRVASNDGNRYHARVAGHALAFDLAFTATQPPLLQGDAGRSRKGPLAESASYYYSLPQLRVDGRVTRNGTTQTVRGTAWLDHEWSSSYMDERASGWDWIGINLDGGGALMVFHMRDASGKKFWAGGSYRNTGGATRVFQPDEVQFTARRHWRSPRTGTAYPVACAVTAGELEITIEPLMDDQESDTRLTTGAVYWEGAVRALQVGKPVGRGYLELTGYFKKLSL